MGFTLWSAWDGLLRPGEAARLQKRTLRSCADLLEGGTSGVVATIERPKTRKTFAKTQHVILEDPELCRLLVRFLDTLEEEERVWPFSGSTLGRRLRKVILMAAAEYATEARIAELWTMACVRAGRATSIWIRERQIEPLRILGRWKRQATLEHYVQEAVAREAAFELHPGERANLAMLAKGAVRWAEEWVEKRERETRWRKWVSGGRLPPPRRDEGAADEGDDEEEEVFDSEDSLDDDW